MLDKARDDGSASALGLPPPTVALPYPHSWPPRVSFRGALAFSAIVVGDGDRVG